MVSMRFGLTDGQPKTLDEIGKVYGVTRERIRQIESKTMSKLRHPSPLAGPARLPGLTGGVCRTGRRVRGSDGAADSGPSRPIRSREASASALCPLGAESLHTRQVGTAGVRRRWPRCLGRPRADSSARGSGRRVARSPRGAPSRGRGQPRSYRAWPSALISGHARQPLGVPSSRDRVRRGTTGRMTAEVRRRPAGADRGALPGPASAGLRSNPSARLPGDRGAYRLRRAAGREIAVRVGGVKPAGHADDAVLRALAEPRRREILTLLARDEVPSAAGRGSST